MISRTIPAIVLGMALAGATAAGPMAAGIPPGDQSKAAGASDPQHVTRKAAASRDTNSTDTQDKAKQQAGVSKRQHDEAKKVIDNMKD